MTVNRPKVFRSAALFVPLLLLFSALYLWVKPQYEPAVQRTANAITRRLSPPSWIDSAANGQWLCHVSRPGAPNRIVYRWNVSLPHLVFLSLALVPALTLATPTTLRNRLRLTGLGLMLVFATHVAVMVGLMRAALWLIASPRSFLCLWLLRMLYVSGQLCGAAIWVLLTWRYWFPASRDAVDF